MQLTKKKLIEECLKQTSKLSNFEVDAFIQNSDDYALKQIKCKGYDPSNQEIVVYGGCRHTFHDRELDLPQEVSKFEDIKDFSFFSDKLEKSPVFIHDTLAEDIRNLFIFSADSIVVENNFSIQSMLKFREEIIEISKHLGFETKDDFVLDFEVNENDWSITKNKFLNPIGTSKPIKGFFKEKTFVRIKNDSDEYKNAPYTLALYIDPRSFIRYKPSFFGSKKLYGKSTVLTGYYLDDNSENNKFKWVDRLAYRFRIKYPELSGIIAYPSR